jgi:predicted secreted protein
MGPTAAFVLFSVIWFMTLFVVLPLRLKTQGDVGQIVPGTQAGAPHELDLKRKLKVTTLVSVILFAVIAGIILSGAITVRDFDWRHQLPPDDGTDGQT